MARKPAELHRVQWGSEGTRRRRTDAIDIAADIEAARVGQLRARGQCSTAAAHRRVALLRGEEQRVHDRRQAPLPGIGAPRRARLRAGECGQCRAEHLWRAGRCRCSGLAGTDMTQRRFRRRPRPRREQLALQTVAAAAAELRRTLAAAGGARARWRIRTAAAAAGKHNRFGRLNRLSDSTRVAAPDCPCRTGQSRGRSRQVT